MMGYYLFENLILKTKSTVADDQIKSRRALERKETHVLDFFDLHLTFPTDPNRVAKQSFNKSDKDTKSPKQMHRSWKPPQKKNNREKIPINCTKLSFFMLPCCKVHKDKVSPSHSFKIRMKTLVFEKIVQPLLWSHMFNFRLNLNYFSVWIRCYHEVISLSF